MRHLLKTSTTIVLLVVLSVLFFCCTSASATVVTASGTCGANLTWELDDEGMLTISGSGKMNNSSDSTLVPWYSHRDSINSVTINSGVTSISSFAFYRYSSLTSIFLPNTLSDIGSYAFTGCSALTEVHIPSLQGWLNINFSQDSSNPMHLTKKLYVDGHLLSHAVIPEGTTAINHYAFYNCSSLISVSIPDSVTTIGSKAFFGCSGLTSITLSDSVTDVGYDAFSGCSNLEEVHISSLDTWMGINFSTSSSNPVSYAKNLHINGNLLTHAVIPEGTAVINDYAFYNCSSLITVSIPDSVTSIGEYAFYACQNMNSISISDSVTFIDNNAFYGCSNLTEVYIPSLKAWMGITFSSADSNPVIRTHALYVNGNLLTHADIPEGITSINDYAFFNCSSLTSLSIPNSVTSIGERAFSSCSGLSSISISNSVTSIGDYAFSDCSGLSSILIPDSVTSIGDYAFSSCSGLSSISIPDSVISIGKNAYGYCSGLTEVHVSSLQQWMNFSYSSPDSHPMFYADHLYINGNLLTHADIPEGITSINNYAFFNCSSLTSVSIPESVNSIGNNAFSGCSALETISIPDSVKTIGQYAFFGCSNLDGIDIPNSVTSINDYVLYGCSNLNSIVIPNSITTIGNHAFYSCINLESITIPDSVKTIGNYAFFNCINLDNVCFSNNLTSIGNNAFRRCFNLKTVRIPSSIKSIGTYAFADCNNLSEIYIFNSNVSIGDFAFINCSSTLTIHGHILRRYIPNLFGDTNDIQKLTITNETSSLNDHVLQYFPNLTSVTMNGNILQNNEYYNIWSPDSKITELILTGDMSSMRFGYLQNCTTLVSVSLPNSITSISASAFSGCTNLTSISIPDSVTSIGSEAFKKCTNLKKIHLPASITSIGNHAFYNCSNVTEVYVSSLEAWLNIQFNGENSNPMGNNSTQVNFKPPKKYLYIDSEPLTYADIPDNITSIGKNTFINCSTLTSVTIPDSITSIGQHAFQNCSSLTSVSLPDSISSINSYTFSGCYSLTSVSFSDSLLSIGEYAFYNCSKLSSIILPDSISSIGMGAFQNCSSLKKVSIPSGVTHIENYTFDNCFGITALTIPASVTSIGYNAFNYCDQLQYITFQGNLPPFRGENFASKTNNRKMTIVIFGDMEEESRENYFSYDAADYSSTVYCYPNTFVAEWAKSLKYTVKYLNKQHIPESITLPENTRLLNGTTLNIVPIVFPEYPDMNIIWSSSAPDIATVENGLVTAHSPGEAIITASCGDIKGTITITVYALVESFELSAQDLYVAVDQTVQLSIKDVLPMGGSANYTWKTDDNTIAVVYNGYVTGRSIGDTILTVTADTGVSRTCNIHVRAPITSFTVSPTQINLKSYDMEYLTAITNPANLNPAEKWITFTSSDPTVASVNEKGLIRYVGAGTTTITAETFDGKVCTCDVICTERNTLFLPKNLRVIEAEAFINNTSFDAVILPDGCETICRQAFANTREDLVVYMPDSITYIEEDAFDAYEHCNVFFICESQNTAVQHAKMYAIPYRIEKLY